MTTALPSDLPDLSKRNEHRSSWPMREKSSVSSSSDTSQCSPSTRSLGLGMSASARPAPPPSNLSCFQGPSEDGFRP